MSKLAQWLEQLESISATNIIKLGLDNILSAAKILELTKPAPYVVTVAGTNGKGTTVKTLEYLLVKSGYNVGTYTSPHLMQFNERITINQENISDDDLVNSFEIVKNKLDENQVAVTYFEFITLSAWYIFCKIRNNLDVVILEIGLGGRLDAVNAIPKDLAIITTIDFDHQDYLGNTLEAIGYEKAGIIEANRPVILGSEVMPESVITQANQKGAAIYQYGKDFSAQSYQLDEYIKNSNLKFSNIATAIKAYELIMLGAVDVSTPPPTCRGSTAASSKKSINSGPRGQAAGRRDLEAKRLQPLDYFKNFSNYIYNLLENFSSDFNLPGRCSWLDQNQRILLDVAHNTQSISNLSAYLSSLKTKKDIKIHAICGMLKDKDITENLKRIEPIIDHWNLVTIDDKRGAQSHYLLEKLLKLNNNIDYNCFEDIKNCFDNCYALINKEINQNSILVIFGSFYLAGPIYNYYCRLTK